MRGSFVAKRCYINRMAKASPPKKDLCEQGYSELFIAKVEQAPTHEDYAKLGKRLNELRQLGKGWDGDNAEPPSPTACELAEELLASLEKLSVRTEYIVPTSDGSVMLQHRARHGLVTWEIDNDGEVGVMVERPEREPEYFSPTAKEMPLLVSKLARHG